MPVINMHLALPLLTMHKIWSRTRLFYGTGEAVMETFREIGIMLVEIWALTMFIVAVFAWVLP